MTPRPLIPILIVALLSSSVPTALATGTGDVLLPDPFQADRSERAEKLRTSLSTDEALDAQWKEKRSAYFSERAAHRYSCRGEVRQANRDNLIPKLLTCYRGELTQEREFLMQERKYVQAFAGPTEKTRSAALESIDHFLDAANTVILAIDSRYFSTQDQLLGARGKLQQNYRAKTWDALTQLRADRLLSWVALLQDDAAHSSPAPSSTFVDCLKTEDGKLRTYLHTGSGTLTALVTSVSACTSLPAFPPSQTGSTLAP